MVDKTLTQLNQASQVDDTDILYAVKGGTTDVSVSVGQLKAHISELIRTPVAIDPLTGTTEFPVDGSLQASPYAPLYSADVREFREFQIDIAAGDFTSPVSSAQIDADIWSISPAIPDNTDLQWRCRDKSVKGDYSGWSEPQTFKTYDIYVLTPVILSPTEGGELSERDQPVTTSAFQMVNSDDTHAASYWTVKNSLGAVAYQTGRDTVNLTSWQPPLGVIVVGESMTVEVVYESSGGFLSEAGVRSFIGKKVPYESLLAVGFSTFNGQYNHYIYGQDVDSFNMLQPSNATGNVSGVCFSPDGGYFAMSTESSPIIQIYKRTGDEFVSLTQPATVPTGVGRGVCFSPDGVHLVVTHDTTPFMTIYKRDGDTFTKLPNPTSLPVASGRGVAFSPDGVHLALAISAAPYIQIYKREGDTFTKITNPVSVPTAPTFGCHFSSNGYLYFGVNDAPCIWCYSVSGDTFTKVSIPSPLIGAPFSIATTLDGSIVAYGASGAGCCLLKNDGGVFTHLQSLTTQASAVSFSRDGVYLCVGGSNAAEYLAVYKRDAGLETYTKLIPSPTAPRPVGTSAVSFYPSAMYPLSP